MVTNRKRKHKLQKTRHNTGTQQKDIIMPVDTNRAIKLDGADVCILRGRDL